MVNRIELQQVARWKGLSDFVSEWFYRPDLKALAIALSVYGAHTRLSERDPVWLFVIGPPGSGKTSIICKSLLGLPAVQSTSDITPRSFISGRSVSSGGSNLLFKLPAIGKKPNETQGMLVFPDFTSLLEMKHETRAETIAVMRHVYDGGYDPQKGMKTPSWCGKVSIVAACTPALERAWSIKRDLGERFIQLRWPREDGIKTARKTIQQIGKHDLVKTLQALTLDFIDPPSLPGPMPKYTDQFIDELTYIAETVAVLRGYVIRDPKSHEIEGTEYETPTRLMKSFLQIAMGHAALFGRDKIGPEDEDLVRRLARDSIPLRRYQFIRNLKPDATIGALSRDTKLPDSSLEHVRQELEALDAIVYSPVKKNCTLTRKFVDLKAERIWQ